jgi:translation initiation factor RLI1
MTQPKNKGGRPRSVGDTLPWEREVNSVTGKVGISKATYYKRIAKVKDAARAAAREAALQAAKKPQS